MHVVKKPLIFLLTLSLSAFNSLHAVGPAKMKQLIDHKDWLFMENKGQLDNPISTIKKASAPGSSISYYAHQGGVYLFCKPGVISFVFTKTGNNNQEQISEATGLNSNGIADPSRDETNIPGNTIASHAEMVLVNANPAALIIATDQRKYYENFYTTGDANKGITNVKSYKTITYQNIYPQINLVLHARSQGMKYEFIVKPGGNPDLIRILWKGLNDKFTKEDGGISYSFASASAGGVPMTIMTESKPVSYQGGKIVESAFVISHGSVGFKLKGYDRHKTLVIDPSLSWATYYGGTGAEIEKEMATDASSNLYITGYTGSSSGIATSGTYQTTSGGGQDAFLVKFDNTGAIQWATYLGGSGNDLAQGVATDGSSVIYIAGTTGSSSGIATSGTYQTTFGTGTNDAYLAKFNGSGALTWATYFGGSSNDGAFNVCTDGSGGTSNVYICGYTLSSSLSNGGSIYQSSNGGGSSRGDAFLAKFNSSGTRQWSTYYGGTSDETAYGVVADGSNVYMTGESKSTGGGLGFGGAFQTSYGTGSDDAFVVKFDASNGSGTWATYYGTASASIGYGVTEDGSGNIFVVGNTTSSSGIATGGAYQTSLAGAKNAFLVKFNSSGARSWGTYYGGAGTDLAEVATTDASNNVYIAGYTSGSSGIAVSGAYQTSNAGLNDAFVAQFNSSGAIQGATYFGGTSDDYGRGVATDGSGNIYLAGYSSSTGLATSGAYQTSNFGSGDVFIAKFTSAALPVSLVSFGAQYLENNVKLNWATASEQNNAYFEIERSQDASGWTKIGRVEGHGTSDVYNSYTSLDELIGIVPSGTLFYRLKQVDFNGSFKYSYIRSVSLSDPILSATAFPNPAGTLVNVTWINDNEAGTVLRIVNMNGLSVYETTVPGKGGRQQQIDLSGLATGAYSLQVIMGNYGSKSKIIYKH